MRMPIKSRKILDNEECLELTLTDGRVVVLEYQDWGTRIMIRGDETEPGEIGFKIREEECGPEEVRVARLIRCFNESFGGHGVGTEAVKWFLFQEVLEPSDLEFPEHDGIRRDNGEHLTGDAPGFVASLKRKQAEGGLESDFSDL
jgi:hypothetical protein